MPSAPPVSSNAVPLPRDSKRTRALIWGLGGVVFGMALLAFLMGAEVSERDLSAVGFWGHVYGVVALFVVGGLDLGVPSGGPAVAQAMLWVAYFAAPFITVASVVEAFLVAVADRARTVRPLHDHIVLVGTGRLARLYVEVIHRLEPGRQVVMVGVDRSGPAEERNDGARGPGAPQRTRQIFGDFRSESVQAQCRLDSAAAVVLMMHDDHLNLEAATAVVSRHTHLANRIVVHLKDIMLKRLVLPGSDGSSALVHTLFGRLGDPDGAGAEASVVATARSQIINAHRIAARHLVLRELLPYFARTQQKDTVVLAGFDGFGQTVLEILQREAAGRFETVVVVDPMAELRVRQFIDQVPNRHGAFRLHAVEGDLQDPAVWERVAAAVGNEDALQEATFVVTTPDDHHNIRVGLWLERRFPGGHRVVRCFHESELTRRLASQFGFQICSDAVLLQKSLAERHRHWFPAAST